MYYYSLSLSQLRANCKTYTYNFTTLNKYFVQFNIRILCFIPAMLSKLSIDVAGWLSGSPIDRSMNE